MNRKDLQNTNFMQNYLTWNDPRLAGRRSSVDAALGKTMGGHARSGLAISKRQFVASLEGEGLNEFGRNKARQSIAAVDALLNATPPVVDRPTNINAITNNFLDIAKSASDRAASEGRPEMRGSGWYFQHAAEMAEAMPDVPSQAVRAAVGGIVSPNKSPQTEQRIAAGLNDLVIQHAQHKINGRTVAATPSAELASIASSEAAAKDPHAHKHSLRWSLRRAGQATATEGTKAISVMRGEMPLADAFNPSTAPKTAAYAEMHAQSVPGSLVHRDYVALARATQERLQGRGYQQGILRFSDSGSSLPWALREDTPTAIDTWMVAAGSGQPLQSRVTTVASDTGKTKTTKISPAKKLTDKRFPLDSASITKSAAGLIGTDRTVTTQAAVSAQHNEALRRASRRIGPVTFDQTGRDLYAPSSLLQETIWTEARIKADADPDFRKEVKPKERTDKNQGKLF